MTTPVLSTLFGWADENGWTVEKPKIEVEDTADGSVEGSARFTVSRPDGLRTVGPTIELTHRSSVTAAEAKADGDALIGLVQGLAEAGAREVFDVLLSLSLELETVPELPADDAGPADRDTDVTPEA